MNNVSRFRSSAGRFLYNNQHHPGYVCVKCRHQLQKASITTSASPKAPSQANDKVPYTERIRRRIWGSERPPGLEDPYGNRSVLDKSQNKGKEPVASEAIPDVNASSKALDAQAEYVPATSWDGLEHIGGATGWWEEAWDKKHQFRGFMSSSKLVSRGDLENAIRRAVIEVYTLVEAGRSPADATNALDDGIIPNPGSVRLSVAHDGSSAVIYPNDKTRQGLLDSTAKSNPIRKALKVRAENTESAALGTTDLSSVQTTSIDQGISVESTRADSIEAESLKDQSWLDVSLKDPVIKFAVRLLLELRRAFILKRI
ncbi:MAG: hypothetical protein Q9187_002939 [Circinaria calcarea]